MLCTFLLRATACRSCMQLFFVKRTSTCLHHTANMRQLHVSLKTGTLIVSADYLADLAMYIAYTIHQNQIFTSFIQLHHLRLLYHRTKKLIKWGLSPSTIPVSFSTSSEGNSPLLRRIRCRRSTPIAWLLCVPCCTRATTKTTLRTEKSVEFLRIKIYHVHIKVIQSPTKTHQLRHSIFTYKSI